MKQRFEMPVGPDAVKGYNLFEIDDFLRSIRSAEERRKLIRRAGLSRQDRDKYETRCGLPHGSVEFAMMLDDRRLGEINKKLQQRFPEMYRSGAQWEAIQQLYQELGSVAIGLQATYPDASRFLITYSLLADRTRRSFQGDYRFSNEYRLMFVQDGGANPPPNNTTAWTYQAVYIAAFANAIVVANAVVWANALVLTLAILAAAVVATAVAVTPIYGQKLPLANSF